MLSEDVVETVSPELTCVVCGAETNANEIEDTNGWRWFSDGKGGLLPLCASCPVPEELLDPHPGLERETPTPRR